MTTEQIVTYYKAKKVGDHYIARCPCPGHTNGDQNPSLTISPGDKPGFTLAHCDSLGHSFDEIVAASPGLQPSAFFPPKPAPAGGPLTVEALAQAKGFTVEYLKSLGVEQLPDGVQVTYRKIDGAIAERHQVRKSLDKGWVWSGEKRGPLEPYGGERRGADWKLLVEGASDCWAAWDRGVPALGIPGSTMAHVLRAEHLDGIKSLYVAKEPDAGGISFINGSAVRLEEIGYTGTAFAMEYPPGIKDLRALYLKYPDPDEFHKHLQKAMLLAVPLEKAPVPSPEPLVEGKTYDYNGGGNSERLVDQHGRDLAYVHELAWLVWTGKRWESDPGEHLVQRRAKAVVKALRVEAMEMRDAAAALPATTGAEKLAAAKAMASAERALSWALRSYSRAPLGEMRDLAQEMVLRKADEFDAQPMLLTVANGTLDLETGKLRPSRREDRLTLTSPVAFDPRAAAPTWERFLRDVMCDRDDLVRYLQVLVGYILTGQNREQLFVIFHGLGENGKSTLLEILRALLGQEYARQTPPHTLMQRKYDGGPSPEIARLKGARLVTSVEPEKGRRLAEGIIKSMTGGDMQTGRHLFKAYFEFVATHKIILACNHKPRISSDGHAMWRRIHLVPFEASFAGRADKEMTRKLLAELPGILNWALAGCLRWQAEGLKPPKEVVAATEAYRQEEDALGDFFAEKCEFERKARVPCSEMIAAYRAWCVENEQEPLSATDFGRAMQDRDIPKPVGERFEGYDKKVKVYHGVRLATAATPATEKTQGEKPGRAQELPPQEILPPAFAVAPVAAVAAAPLDPEFNAYLIMRRALRRGDDPEMAERAARAVFGADAPLMGEILAALDRLPPHVEPPPRPLPPHNRGECEWRECPEHPLDPNDRFDPRNDVDEEPEEEEALPSRPVRQLPDYCPHGNPRLDCQQCCKHGMLQHRCISCSGNGNTTGSGPRRPRPRIRVPIDPDDPRNDLAPEEETP